jgi:hypothetical protein
MKSSGFLNPTKDQPPSETTRPLETHYSGTTGKLVVFLVV